MRGVRGERMGSYLFYISRNSDTLSRSFSINRHRSSKLLLYMGEEGLLVFCHESQSVVCFLVLGTSTCMVVGSICFVLEDILK